MKFKRVFLVLSILGVYFLPVYAMEGSERLCDTVLRAILARLSNDADINRRDGVGNTPLHNAVIFDLSEIINLLIEKKADLTIRNQAGYTPLQLAVIYNKTELIPLFSGKANFNLPDAQGNTPLHLATERNYLKIIPELIKGGAYVTLYNQASAVYNTPPQTPFDLILQHKITDYKLKDICSWPCYQELAKQLWCIYKKPNSSLHRLPRDILPLIMLCITRIRYMPPK